MPSYRIAFPSKFLKAEDLGNTRPIVTIASVDLEDVGELARVVRELEAALVILDPLLTKAGRASRAGSRAPAKPRA